MTKEGWVEQIINKEASGYAVTPERDILLKAVERLIKNEDHVLEEDSANYKTYVPGNDKYFATRVTATVRSVREEAKERDKVERIGRAEVAWEAKMEREAQIEAEKKGIRERK